MTDNRTTELLPCPFCGGEAELITAYGLGHWVQCPHDECLVTVETVDYETEAEAVEAWNTRAPVEYEGFFYLPKPKKNIVQYGEMRTEKTENGYKMQQSVEVIESAIRSYGDELGEYIMKRICEAWNTRHERTCHNTWDVELTGRLRFQCSECGAVSLEITPGYCPSCGRKVVNNC